MRVKEESGKNSSLAKTVNSQDGFSIEEHSIAEEGSGVVGGNAAREACDLRYS